MNLIYTKSIDEEKIDCLRWRIDNTTYLLEEYVPFLLNKLVTDKTSIKNVELNELSAQYSTEGFSYKNLKLLSFILETNKGEFDIKIKLPVPSGDDIFTINRKHFILVNVLNDDIYFLLNKNVHSVTFKITHEGLWYPFRGSQSKSQVGTPLIQILYAVELLDKWFPNYRVTTGHCDESAFMSIPFGSDEFFNFDEPIEINYNDNTTAYQWILRSLDKIKKWSDVEKQNEQVLTKVVEQNPFDYSFEYEFLLGHCSLHKLYDSILMNYKDKYLLSDEIHLDFKRVNYYSTLLKPLEKRVMNILGLFKRAKNADISWHQRIPNNLLTKDSKTNKYLQYLELKSPFEEIALKTKLVIPLKNIPSYMRKTMSTAYNQICPLDTPDNKNIGVVQHFAITSKLDLNGKFI